MEVALNKLFNLRLPFNNKLKIDPIEVVFFNNYVKIIKYILGS